MAPELIYPPRTGKDFKKGSFIALVKGVTELSMLDGLLVNTKDPNDSHGPASRRVAVTLRFGFLLFKGMKKGQEYKLTVTYGPNTVASGVGPLKPFMPVFEGPTINSPAGDTVGPDFPATGTSDRDVSDCRGSYPPTMVDDGGAPGSFDCYIIYQASEADGNWAIQFTGTRPDSTYNLVVKDVNGNPSDPARVKIQSSFQARPGQCGAR
jgi:hypothetical protein